MNKHSILMTFGAPPSIEDMETIAAGCLESLPRDLRARCADIAITIDDFPDELIENELNLDDSFALLALYQSAGDTAPGVTRKQPGGGDTLVLYRRPILDLWCESGEELTPLIRRIMIEEIGQKLELTESEVTALIETVEFI